MTQLTDIQLDVLRDFSPYNDNLRYRAHTVGVAMRRREFFGLVGCAAAFSQTVHAQEPAPGVWRVGLIPSSDRAQTTIIQGLKELGYVEGKNLVVAVRRTDGSTERLAAVAAELIGLKMDVIVAAGTQVARALKDATNTIPIVMFSSDPVGAGLITSLGHPGGNVTGLSLLTPDISGKRLELLREVTGGSRFGVLWNSDDPSNAVSLKETQDAARTARFELVELAVRNPNDFVPAFTTLAASRLDGLAVVMSPLMDTHLPQLADLALNAKLPSIYSAPLFPQSGGLLSYGANFTILLNRAAIYIDKLFKGARPADLPVEQPTKFDLLINLKTAKALRLEIPPTLLARADEVIE
jgi:putative ABC transport system substrate-binding protein